MQPTIVSQARHELNPAAMASTLEEAGFYYFLRSPNVARFGEWVDDPKIIQKYPTNMRKQYKTLFK